MKPPRHHIDEIVSISENETLNTAVAVITEIIISKEGVRYRAKIGFDYDTIYDREEYLFEDDCEPCYSIISKVGEIETEV